MARYRNRGRSRRPQRVSWFPVHGGGSLTVTNPATAKANLISQYDAEDLGVEHEAVIERMRGSLGAYATGSDVEFVAAVHLAAMIVPAGIQLGTGLPNLTDSQEGDDYFLFRSCAVSKVGSVATPLECVIDSKAKRRIERGASIAFLAQAEGIHSATPNTSGVGFGFTGRILMRFN